MSQKDVNELLLWEQGDISGIVSRDDKDITAAYEIKNEQKSGGVKAGKNPARPPGITGVIDNYD